MVRAAPLRDWPAAERLLRAIGFTEGQPSEHLRARFCAFAERADHCLLLAEDGGRLIG